MCLNAKDLNQTLFSFKTKGEKYDGYIDQDIVAGKAILSSFSILYTKKQHTLSTTADTVIPHKYMY